MPVWMWFVLEPPVLRRSWYYLHFSLMFKRIFFSGSKILYRDWPNTRARQTAQFILVNWLTTFICRWRWMDGRSVVSIVGGQYVTVLYDCSMCVCVIRRNVVPLMLLWLFYATYTTLGNINEWMYIFPIIDDDVERWFWQQYKKRETYEAYYSKMIEHLSQRNAFYM